MSDMNESINKLVAESRKQVKEKEVLAGTGFRKNKQTNKLAI